MRVRVHSRCPLLFGSLAFGAWLAGAPAFAADAALPLKARPIPHFDWSGFYVGGHVGYLRGDTRATVSDPAPNDIGGSYGALYGGLFGGYNFVLPSRTLIGIEADLSFPNYLGADDVISSRTTTTSDVAHRMDYIGTVRARLGHVFDNWMLYGTGGFAWTQTRFQQTPGVNDDINKIVKVVPGWTAGLGAEFAIAPQWMARVEYLYSRFSGADVTFPSGTRYQASFDANALRLGLVRKLGGSDAQASAGAERPVEAPRWEFHAQSTYIQQGYGAFHSPYLGPNSLTPWPQTRQTATATAYLGMRLWDGGEAYYAPELDQGFGLHDTTGAGGFPNGEAQKSNFPYPHYNTSRLMLRQTFGFGGEQEELESQANQIGKKVDVARLTVQVGRFPVTDVFDGNAYARDPRTQFMNWSIWAAGAFDYGADKIGLTNGAVADFNQKNWALRAGYFLVPSESNGNNYDMRVFDRGNYVIEYERRYELFGRAGKLRTIGWINSTFSGSYGETLDNPALNLDITQTRKTRIKYGYVVNVEQSLADDVGLFGRWSWNDGKTEIMSFTDIDSSLSGGLSIKGQRWNRPDDVIGIGAALNMLSQDHRDFLAAGGMGILVGDGALNYRPERVLETYYSYAINKETSLTLDYQLLVNPGYNADRGPVSVYAARIHWER